MCHWDSKLRWQYCNKSTFLAALYMCFQIYFYSFLLKTLGYVILVMKGYLANTGRKPKQVSIIFWCPQRWEELFWCTAKHCIMTVWHNLQPLSLHNQISEIHEVDNITTFLLYCSDILKFLLHISRFRNSHLVLCLILRLWCKEDMYFSPWSIMSSLCTYLFFPLFNSLQKKKKKSCF